MRIHLYYQPKKTPNGTIGYYSLATSTKEGKVYKKKIIHRIGRLSEEQAETYRALLKGINDPDKAAQLCSLDDIFFKDEKRYLDVLALSTLWERLGLDGVFSKKLVGTQKISTEQIARILTINRLLAPASKSATIPWLASTMLPKIMGFDASDYRKSKIFGELDKIHAQKPAIEKHFATFSARQKDEAYDVYFFDGTTSWFEGSNCSLAKSDLEKTRGFYPKVVSLMLVTDKRGYPIAWDVEDGHTKDTTCFGKLAQRAHRDYGIREITYCFDRGIASVANFRAAGEVQAKFISGIKDNQIKAVFDLKAFEKTREKILVTHAIEPNKEKRRILGIDGFYTHDRKIFFKDLGVIGGMRYIASFNLDVWDAETQRREKRLSECLSAVSAKNLELRQAKRDRDFAVTERDLLEILGRFQLRDVIEYALIPITPQDKFQSFEIKCSLKWDKLNEFRQADGVLIYITDHIETLAHPRQGFQLHASEIIAHYKNKYIIENAFRELKSFLELRPFHVWTETHVKAHYDIAIIACFINNYILQHLSRGEADVNTSEINSLRDFYNALQFAGSAVELKAPKGIQAFKMKPIPAPLSRTLNSLGLGELTRPARHTSLGVQARQPA